jgi:hypothetical protein
MIEPHPLDLPPWLSRKLTPAEREAAWLAEPNKPVRVERPPGPPTWEELARAARERDREQAAETERMRALEARQKSAARIEQMHANFAKNGGPPPKRKSGEAALRARRKARA